MIKKWMMVSSVGAMVMMGAVYASWTQSLEIRQDFSTTGLAYHAVISNGQASPYTEISIKDAEADESDSTLQIESKGLYPTATQTYDLTVTNTGGLPGHLMLVENWGKANEWATVFPESPVELMYQVPGVTDWLTQSDMNAYLGGLKLMPNQQLLIVVRHQYAKWDVPPTTGASVKSQDLQYTLECQMTQAVN